MPPEFDVLHLYLSPGHNYLGHHERPPGNHPLLEVAEVQCVAGQGIRGDRFFGFQPDYKGQITFFAFETYLTLCQQLGIQNRHPGVFRRNVITGGIDLNALVGQVFELQGIRFQGVSECSPCYWMNQAFGPGAENALRGRGGLRARILSNGTLRVSRKPSAA